jgi:hypothetical protein
MKASPGAIAPSVESPPASTSQAIVVSFVDPRGAALITPSYHPRTRPVKQFRSTCLA